MQTNLLESFRNTSVGQEAEDILRKCVHCGFCNATCPTYQLLGDEADGPRGRIYQIKEMLEGAPTAQLTRKHLDRCLLCRACETTCPSGVKYARLAEIGQDYLEKQRARPIVDKFKRQLIQGVFPCPWRVRLLVRLATLLKPLMPQRLSCKLPTIQSTQPWPRTTHQRKVIIHEGCVQSVFEPGINVATAKVLDAVEISVVRTAPVKCCGALHHHLSLAEKAQQLARDNIDQWWPHIEAGVEAIISNASGCGQMIQDYPHLLKDDAEYARKAEKIASITVDIVQILQNKTLHLGNSSDDIIAFQAPCSLQHGLQLTGQVGQLLSKLGLNVVTPEDAHLCCGSAGSYSILQPEISEQLLKNKLDALNRCNPDHIVTANIGCLLHMKTAANVPVMHWIELVAEKL
ncbi:MAG: glycolate oxidase subunit GlcF [Methylococcales bacterium]